MVTALGERSSWSELESNIVWKEFGLIKMKKGASHFRERDKLDLIYLHRVREIFKKLVFQNPTLKNKMRFYEVCEVLDRFCQRKSRVKWGLTSYKTWKEALLEED